MAAPQRAGFEHIRTKGDHAKLRREGRVVIVPLRKELKGGTTASILRQAGLTADESRDLL